MRTIAYCSPFVPPEWIAAHGMWPEWLVPGAGADGALLGVTRGLCPYAGALIDTASSGMDAAALVLSTACDQMRYAAAMLAGRGDCPVFLLNMPSTWQTAAARGLYLDELRRLGHFLEELGGKSPRNDELVRFMLAYDQARQSASAETNSRRLTAVGADTVPLAVVGGPLMEPDRELFEIIEQSGGRVVLDATEGGERTLPRPFDPARLEVDPLQELADAYFDSIPDAFRRPNTLLYEWLGRELAARQVAGIVFRRYAWCDLWHGELERLRQWAPVPVLDIDAGPDETSVRSRLQGRIEAFLETLQ
jgi:benzoyl-CoA reductase/2-hydroxyglutaryl-CoA dehydratase subunit BcrC/BadD/HgdB